MGNLVIVAIPDENDRVWKVSSEKIPHLTLLFLGDVDKVANLEQIMRFVEHAANTSLRRFYLTVDRRGELGDDKADVLFFKKNRYDFKAINDFRNVLLQDHNIKTAYDSTEQFDGPWNPHLTLGYPETPAKLKSEDISSFFNVSFNKIAVWIGDFDGPDWLLKDYWEEFNDIPMDMTMSDLEHYGTKGMKWGVRRYGPGVARVGVGASLAGPIGMGVAVASAPSKSHREKKAGPRPGPADRLPTVKDVGRGIKSTGLKVKKGAKASSEFLTKMGDHHFEGKASDAKTFMRVHDRAAKKFDTVDAPRINNKSEYRGADFKRLGPQAKLTRQYEKEQMDAFDARLKESAKSEGTNWSSTRRLDIDGSYRSEDGWGLKVVNTEKAKHAAADNVIFVRVERNETGHIIAIDEIELIENTMAQTTELGIEFLTHIGVKGMKWGVRKPPPPPVTPSARSLVPQGAKRKTKIKTEGGENHEASPDAIKVAQAHAKLKKSGAVALSNAELREVANRLQLEQQVKQLTSPKSRKFVTGFLGSQGKQTVGGLAQKKLRTQLNY